MCFVLINLMFTKGRVYPFQINVYILFHHASCQMRTCLHCHHFVFVVKVHILRYRNNHVHWKLRWKSTHFFSNFLTKLEEKVGKSEWSLKVMLFKKVDAFWFLLLLLQDSGLLDASTSLLDRSLSDPFRSHGQLFCFCFRFQRTVIACALFIDKFHPRISPRAWSVIPAEI